MKKDVILLLDSPKPSFKEVNYIEAIFTIEDYYSTKLFNEINYDYFLKDIYDFKEIFTSVNTLAHKNFFKDLSLNTPNVLNHTSSQKRFSNHTNMLKLATCFMRGGKKVQATKLISVAIFKVFYDLNANLLKLKAIPSFKNLHYLFSSAYMQSGMLINSSLNGLSLYTLFSTLNISLGDKGLLSSGELFKNEDLWPYNLYNSSLKNFNLLFLFYIHKVDKNIYKNSRGKSGKFTFVWKYVKPYRRRTLIGQWLMKEIRVAPGTKLQDRLTFIIQKFLLTPRETMIWKINKFSQNYVYYHLRKSLGETCKTVMN